MFLIKRIQSQYPEVTQLFNYIVEAMNNLITGTPLEGKLLKDVALISGSANLINHKLGRAPIGFIVTKYSIQVAAPIWQLSMTNIQIDLRTATSCTVDVWVF